MSCRNIIGVCIVLCIVTANSRGLRAQSGSGEFHTYFERLPKPTAALAEHELLQADPNTLDTTADIARIERQLTQYFENVRGRGPSRSNVGQNTSPNKESGNVSIHAEKPSNKEDVSYAPQSEGAVSTDSCLALLRLLQRMDHQFETSIHAIENAYTDRVRTADDAARALQTSEPCKGSIECSRRHQREHALSLSSAERFRFDRNQEIVRTQLRELGPVFASVDAAIPPDISRVSDRNRRRILEELGMKTVSVFVSVAERLKLDRIYLSNCSRLLHQANIQ